MRTGKLILYLFTIGFITQFLCSCMVHRPLVSRPSENNDTYKVHYLFEHEGCKVYRFRDNGNYVYFTNCSDNVISIKNDSTKATVQTIGNRKPVNY